MVMELNPKRIFGLVGPSGVGKGFIKEAIRRSFPETFSELIVATTRPKRFLDELDRLPGLSHEQFLNMVKRGQILFPHQPFGENSDWYGFAASSFSEVKPMTTEVHVDNVKSFRDRFRDGLVLIALIADPGYLESNMKQRGDAMHEIKKRLTAATNEMAAIALLYQEGTINHVIEVNSDNRDSLVSLVVALLSKHL